MPKSVLGRRGRVVAAALAGSLLVAGCSADGEPSSGPVPTPGGTDAPSPPEVAVGDAAALVDLRPGTEGSFPSDGVALGDRLVFGAYARRSGLWVTDGTAVAPLGRVGPVLDEIEDGPDVVFTEVDGVLYFRGDAGAGLDLWRTDATASGTRMVADLTDADRREGYDGPRQLTAVGDTLFFVTADDDGTRLWRSDGTAAGTSVVVAQPGASRESVASNLTAVGDTLFFAMTDPATGEELWASDGTAEGTRLVADIRPGTAGSGPLLLTAVGDRVFFAATDATHGNELWVSDGSEGGTRLVEDISPGAIDPYAPDPYPEDDVEPPRPYAGLEPLGVLGDRLLFSADDGRTGEELWISDGTAEGTRIVADIDPVTVEDGIDGSDPSPVHVWEGSAYFSASDGRHGRELWRTDGTAEGTRLVADINTATSEYDEPAGSGPASFAEHEGRLWFSAYGDETGGGLWRTDGTAAGTELVVDVSDVAGGGYGNAPSSLVTAGGELFFSTHDELLGTELWSTSEAATSVPRVRSTRPPRITGDPVVGGTLRADPGAYAPAAGVTYQYRWFVRSDVVPGEDGLTFALRPGTVGADIGFRVIATSPGRRPVAVRAAPTAPVRPR